MTRAAAQEGVPGVVGFDLDMTLVDSRAGIVACMQQVLADRGVRASEQQLWPLIGAPLHDNLAAFLPADQVEDAAQDYRRRYLVDAVPVTTAMPGALELVDALHAAGSRVLVVSAKTEAAVHAVLEEVGLKPDLVAGELFARDKATVLLAEGADAYVGDHTGDVEAAKAAGARSIAVTTGPHDAHRLRAAGADEVVGRLADLMPLWGLAG